MTFQELAAVADSKDYSREAALAYEIVLQESEPTLETFLNLAVLYFVCTDFGYSAHHHILPEFSAKAYERALEILDKAEEGFGKHAEISFWRLYFNFINLGEGHFENECEQLASSGESLIPYFYLFAFINQERYLEPAERLLKIVENGETARKRYVKSVIEGALTRLRHVRT